MNPDYTPRPYFQAYHDRDKRWTCIVAHRRAGKTVAVVFDLLTCALGTSKKNARYGYLAPYYSQAKAVAWDYLKRFAAPVAVKISESELSVELFNGSRVRLYGADNPDALRGQYFDGIVLDEYGTSVLPYGARSSGRRWLTAGAGQRGLARRRGATTSTTLGIKRRPTIGYTSN